MSRDRVPHTAPTADIETVDDVEEMVRTFYADVAQDGLLGPIFNDVARVDWSAHIPKLTQFWSRALLDEPGYSGNPFAKHRMVHERSPFQPKHFERWLELFHETVERGWVGPNASKATTLARNVARVHSEQLTGVAVELNDY